MNFLDNKIAKEYISSTPEQVIATKSNTFSSATKLYPEPIKTDIRLVYAFVRMFDDFIDQPDSKNPESDYVNTYFWLKDVYHKALNDQTASKVEIIDRFIEVQNRYQFNQEWVEGFFRSMEMDLDPGKIYRTVDDVAEYNYGSAGVIGLMCAKIFGISEKYYESALYLGYAFQYINFIRDPYEDIEQLERNYFPLDSFPKGRYVDLHQMNRTELRLFIHNQLGIYRKWLEMGVPGIHELVRKDIRVGLAVLTATFLYEKTAYKISSNPELILLGKVSPSKFDKSMAVIKAAIYSVFVRLFRTKPRIIATYEFNG